MASGATLQKGNIGEMLRQAVINLGQADPGAGGVEELLNDFNNGLLAFNPPSLADIGSAPANALAAPYPRQLISSDTLALATGVLTMVAVWLPKNTVVNNLNALIGTTGSAGPTHQWFGLFDKSRNLLATTADGTSTAITASTSTTPSILTAAVATTAAGAATTFTTTYSGLYYVGIMVSSSSAQPTLSAYSSVAAMVNAIPPILAGTADGSLTTPETFPFQSATLTPTVAVPYLFVS